MTKSNSGRPLRSTINVDGYIAFLAVAAMFVVGATPSPETGAAVIDGYRAALASVPSLRDMVFQYTESRTGPRRTIVEEHRVYRRVDGAERNDTIMVNGAQVVPALVRYSSDPTWPYDVRQFTVTTADYNALPIGPTIVDGKHAFGFSTVRTSTGDFAITGLYVDVVRLLPLRETFSVSGGGCAGTGSIDFGPGGGTWLPMSVKANCTVGDSGATFKETLTFHDYSFPPSLPPDIFGGQS